MIEEWLAVFSEVANYLGIRHTVTSVRRSSVQQTAIYRRRKTSSLPAARPGSSTHEYGLAFDVVAADPRQQSTLGQIGEALGLYWGGRFRTPDPPHFQIVSPADWNRFWTVSRTRRA